MTFLALELVGCDDYFDSDDEDIAALRDRVDDVLMTTIDEHAGRSLQGQADAIQLSAVFASPTMAALAAIALHERIAELQVPKEFGVMARAALHTGDVQLRNGAYLGATVNRARRSLGRAEPGCTLVSQQTATLIRSTLPAGARLIVHSGEGDGTRYLLVAPGAEVPTQTPSPAAPTPVAGAATAA